MIPPALCLVINFLLTLFPVSMWSCGHRATRQNKLLDWSPLILSGSMPRQFVQCSCPSCCCVLVLLFPQEYTRASLLMVPNPSFRSLYCHISSSRLEYLSTAPNREEDAMLSFKKRKASAFIRLKPSLL